MPLHHQSDASLHRPVPLTLTPIAHAARIALCGILLLGGATLIPAMAQSTADAAAQSDQVRPYNIPAGSLDQVLGSFGRAAGVMIAIDPALTSGLRSDGLQGKQSVASGLSILLTPHKLEAIPGANGGYKVRRQSVSDTTLPTVSVVAPALDANSEGSRSYAARATTLGKSTKTLRETPQPVTVLTRQLIEDRGLLDLTDVLQNTPGVTVDYTDSERVTYFSRGFQIDALQIDGLTMNQSGSIFVQPDTAVLDRVEVLRGASGMIRGSGNPSATVNMVRKRPTHEFQASAALTLGSWDRRRLEADISGPLNEAGTLRGRVVAVDDSKDFFQKARHEDRKVFYGVLEADLGPRTTLTASLQHTDLDATGAWGNLPGNFDGTPLNLPRDMYLGAAWNTWNRYNQQALTELVHRFDNDWTVKASAAYTRLRMKDYGFKQSYFTRASTTNPYLFDVETSTYTGDASDQLVLAASANGPFTLFGRKHELIVGAESLRNKVVATNGGKQNKVTGIDIRNWDPYTSYPETFLAITGTGAPSTTSQQGVYGTARLSLTDPLTLIIGARVSWWDYKAPRTPASNYEVNKEITPYAALTYELSKQLSAYASYTEIFTPQDAKDANGNILPPVTGQDYEAGLKGEFFGGRLNAAMGIFRINNNGKAVEDTNSYSPCLPYYTTGYCRVAGGKQRSEGWEMEVSGELAPGWQMMAGYTNTRTKYLKDTAANTGQPLRSIDPRHQLRVFTSYRIGSETQGWTIGGGAQMQSDSFVRSGAITSRQGGYAVYNAMLGYRFDKTYSIQMNVNNVFDKVYYKKYAPTGIGYYYGDPRNVMVTLRANF
jgi:outer membrane receptor for ferric coprogen and ferric-rhodotorulic acid